MNLFIHYFIIDFFKYLFILFILYLFNFGRKFSFIKKHFKFLFIIYLIIFLINYPHFPKLFYFIVNLNSNFFIIDLKICFKFLIFLFGTILFIITFNFVSFKYQLDIVFQLFDIF